MNRKLKLLSLILVLPLILGSCAKNFNQSALADAAKSMAKTTGDVELQHIIDNPNLYYAFGQAYTEDIITDGSNLNDFLANNYDINAGAIWGDASKIKTLYVIFAVLKSDKKSASLHFGANSTFVSFKQQLGTEFKEGNTVNFKGSDSAGYVTLKGTFAAGKIINTKIKSSTSLGRPFSRSVSLDSL